MKNLIIKFLGIDTIQEENKKLKVELSRLRYEVETTDWNEIARDSFSYDELAENIDLYDLVEHMDVSDIAYNIDLSELASNIDTSTIAGEIDMEDVIDQTDINIDTIAEQVAERIAEREGLQHLISEDTDRQDNTGVTTDAVDSMIHTAIQQFADSIEVMVSAKLNINK